jgi:hypothetical protein
MNGPRACKKFFQSKFVARQTKLDTLPDTSSGKVQNEKAKARTQEPKGQPKGVALKSYAGKLRID